MASTALAIDGTIRGSVVVEEQIGLELATGTLETMAKKEAPKRTRELGIGAYLEFKFEEYGYNDPEYKTEKERAFPKLGKGLKVPKAGGLVAKSGGLIAKEAKFVYQKQEKYSNRPSPKGRVPNLAPYKKSKKADYTTIVDTEQKYWK
eukprot:CAMPEP_0170979118 /NCGR_PEP_ID=MMETSP0736-20130129/1605_1 /TAXON_ID=186038 /ORGANISM="Fragilariopsis kerguelensis, Strain L26-C5" /LENGTH=147 /DNA_ID=CAMNT_0011401619 /DNA_START=74 /DNA_END=517 /DNA_ORIENTATION=-